MISLFGHVTVFSALLVAVAGSVSSLLGGSLAQPRLATWGRRAAHAVAVLTALATALMIFALVTHDFSVRYVFDVGRRDIPLFYTVIALWAALEGSILLWTLILSVYTVTFILLLKQRLAPLQPYIVGLLLAISAFFLFVIAFAGDPFLALSPVPPDGQGPNPLLQNHPMMGLHPPVLYGGYVGLSVPFAVIIASLVRGVPDATTFRVIRQWTLVPWTLLSLGIVAGMWWSYAVLGWGGYWSWDPVENASLMPWLVATAFLHSLQVQQRRQMLKTWTISLAIAAFLLSILGTFLTRSGILTSVHSFTQSSVGPVFLIFLGVVLIGSLILVSLRSAALTASGALDAAICRETAFLLNNLFLVAVTFTILLGTVFPLIAEAAGGSSLSVGGPYFNHVAVPIGLALLFLMGAGPALPWGATNFAELQYRLLVPVSLAVAVVFLSLLLGLRGIGTLVTFGLAVFALTVTLQRVAADIRARRRNTREGSMAATGRLLAANPRRYGGYLAHVGVLVMVIGIAASQAYGQRSQATLQRGQSISVGGYTVTYRTFSARKESNRMVLAAVVQMRRGGDELGSLAPSVNVFVQSGQPVVTPAVREEPLDLIGGIAQGKNPLPELAQLLHGRNPFDDLYVVLQSIQANVKQPQRTVVTLQVLVNPMVGFIWLGGGLIGLGGIFALIPARRRRVSAVESEPILLRAEEASA